MVKSDKQLGKRSENKGVGENKREATKEAVQRSVWIRASSPVLQASVLVASEAGSWQAPHTIATAATVEA